MKTVCPCGLKQAYSDCCGVFLSGEGLPGTPEALMRSRYTAYSKADIEYIGSTMTGPAAHGFNPDDAKAWAEHVIWVDLNVVDAPKPEGNRGYVEFIARFIEGNHLHVLHEKSEFLKDNERWFYVDGEQFKSQTAPQKIGRNTSCPCESGKKFKQCHGRSY